MLWSDKYATREILLSNLRETNTMSVTLSEAIITKKNGQLLHKTGFIIRGNYANEAGAHFFIC